MTAEHGEPADPNAAPPVADVMVDYDLLCVNCGYNLRTLRLNGRCPECGIPVSDSWTPAPPLLRADKAWLAGLRKGMSLVLIALLASVIVGVIAMVGIFLIMFTSGLLTTATPSFKFPWWYLVTMGVVSLGLLVLGMYAVFRATTREPGVPDQEDPRTRWWCRRVLVAWMAMSAISWPLGFLVGFDPQTMVLEGPLFIVSTIAGIVGSALLLAAWACLTSFWRTLAVRAADRSLIGQTRAVLWCVAVTACLFVVAQGVLLIINPVWTQMATATGSGAAGGTNPTSQLTALGYLPAPTTGPATPPPTTTGVWTATMPATMPFTGPGGMNMIAMMVTGCFTALLELALFAFGIWWVVLVFRYRSLLQRIVDSSVDAEPTLEPTS